MKILKHIWPLLFVVMIGCEDAIDLDVPTGDTRVVVDALLLDVDSVHIVTLSLTSPYFEDGETPRLTGANVKVVSNTGDTVQFTESTAIPGDYIGEFKLVDGVQYNLDFTVPNGTRYLSYAEQLNRVSPIDSIYQSEEVEPAQGDFREEGYAVYIDTYEPEGQGDYYRWITFINGEQDINPFNQFTTDDRLVDGNPIIKMEHARERVPGDFVEVWQMSISERAYNFWNLFFTQLTNFGGPFDTPPAPVEGNIYNPTNENEQVLGFFGISRVSKASMVVVQLP